MFCYDNGKVCVLVMPRCGHTSMTGYFGLIPHIDVRNSLLPWRNAKSKRVLVLRNPIDRVKSAMIHCKTHGKPPEFSTDQHWFAFHSSPYLQLLSDTPFDIIPFETLSDYIPMHEATLSTNTGETTKDEIEFTPSIQSEYERYLHYRQKCEVISVEEWKEITP